MHAARSRPGGGVLRRFALVVTVALVAVMSTIAPASSDVTPTPDPSVSPSDTPTPDPSASATPPDVTPTDVAPTEVAPTTDAAPAPSTPPSESTAPAVSSPPAPKPVVTKAAPTRRPAAVPLVGSLRLVASTFVAVGLTYDGIVSVPTGGGPVDAMKFTLTSASVGGLRLDTACVGGQTLVAQASGTVALGQSTLLLLTLDATVGGAPVSFSVASPPTFAFPSPVELDQVDSQGLGVTAATVTAPLSSTTVAAC